MNMSAGDWIAIVLGGGAILRWALDVFRTDSKTDRDQIAEVRREIDIHIALCEQHNAWLKEAMLRMENSISGLQRQMSRVSTSQPERIYEIGRQNDGGKG